MDPSTCATASALCPLRDLFDCGVDGVKPLDSGTGRAVGLAGWFSGMTCSGVAGCGVILRTSTGGLVFARSTDRFSLLVSGVAGTGVPFD